MTKPVALYRHFDLNGELLYVGITNHPQLRWLQHRETSPWAWLVADTTLHWLPDRAKAAAAERRAIRTERPLFNTARPAGCSSEAAARNRYLRTGVSGLPRRVRCRTFPDDYCITCGPDADSWLDGVAVVA